MSDLHTRTNNGVTGMSRGAGTEILGVLATAKWGPQAGPKLSRHLGCILVASSDYGLEVTGGIKL